MEITPFQRQYKVTYVIQLPEAGLDLPVQNQGVPVPLPFTTKELIQAPEDSDKEEVS